MVQPEWADSEGYSSGVLLPKIKSRKRSPDNGKLLMLNNERFVDSESREHEREGKK